MAEGRTINTNSYKEINVSNGGQYAEGNIINYLSGEQQQTLAEAAAEIQELLVQRTKTLIQIETTTELEEILIDRIRKMSIEQQIQVLEFLDTSIPESIVEDTELIKESLETAVEDTEPEMSPLERRQKIVEIMGRLAARGGVMPGVDILEWQREERKDRPLPGRED